MDILVTGATGFVGSHLVPALLDAGHDVRALVRDRSRYDGPEGVAVYEGDLLDPGSFDDAVDGVEAAYYLVHSMRAGEDYAERDRRAARNFVAAAEAGGVERVVYLGGLGEEQEQLSEHLRSRREVEHILAESDAALTSLRAAIVIGDGSASFEMVRQLATRLPVMITPQWVDTACQPIAVADVVTYLVGVLDEPATTGRTFEIGGPDVLSYREVMLKTAEVVTGRRPLILPVPVLTPRLSAGWVHLVTDVPREVAHPLILGLKNAVVVSDDSIQKHVPVELTPFEEAVAAAVADPVAPPVESREPTPTAAAEEE